MAPILVTTKEHIPTLNYVYGGMAVLGEIVTLVSVTRWVEEGKRDGSLVMSVLFNEGKGRRGVVW